MKKQVFKILPRIAGSVSVTSRQIVIYINGAGTAFLFGDRTIQQMIGALSHVCDFQVDSQYTSLLAERILPHKGSLIVGSPTPIFIEIQERPEADGEVPEMQRIVDLEDPDEDFLVQAEVYL